MGKLKFKVRTTYFTFYSVKRGTLRRRKTHVYVWFQKCHRKYLFIMFHNIFPLKAGVYCFHYEPSNCRENTVVRGTAKRLNADQVNSNVEIKGLSNLIIQTDTDAHEREPTGRGKQLTIIHMKYPRMSDK